MTTLQTQTWPAFDLSLPQPSIALPQAEQLKRRSERLYTFQALNAARQEALWLPEADILHSRTIILSDVHKGDRHPQGDDFRHNEWLYGETLRYYLDHDYRLVLNGDIEEGWKSAYSDIIAAYESTAFALEREFATQGRYYRTYGNHDLEWADPRLVDRYLKPVLGGPVQVHAAIMLGPQIMIVHGHQGDINSDRRAWLSRRVVRYLWRPLQCLLHLRINHPAQNHAYHVRRDTHLHRWACANRLLLIAGHTHRPVFHPPDAAPSFRSNGATAAHYLNDGCCVHTDGLTGVEIERGEIRLVRWSAARGTAIRSVFQSADLLALLAGV